MPWPGSSSRCTAATRCAASCSEAGSPPPSSSRSSWPWPRPSSSPTSGAGNGWTLQPPDSGGREPGVGALDRSLTVDKGAAGWRLDRWLARELPGQSRSRLQSLITEGAVLLDGRPARPSSRLRAGQAVALHLPEPRPAVPRAQDIPITVVHEDRRLLVIEKPAGLVVHPGAGAPDGTLVNALLHHVRDLSGIGGELRPGIVHRLDKGTSGLMVVAKDDATHRDLVRQFAGRT